MYVRMYVAHSNMRNNLSCLKHNVCQQLQPALPIPMKKMYKLFREGEYIPISLWLPGYAPASESRETLRRVQYFWTCK